MTEEAIPIVFSTDHNFVMPTCVSVFSLLNSDKTVSYDIFILLDTDVTEEDRNLIQEQVKSVNPKSVVSFIQMKEGDFSNAYTIRGITKATYFRLLIPWLLPQFDKIIYSDGDIIFNSGLQPLYESTDLKQNYIAGVNVGFYHRGTNKEYILSLGLNPDEYINAGLVIINSKQWRENNLKDQWKDMHTHSYKNVDQDIINILCKGRILNIDSDWNIRPRDIERYKIKDPKVIHYAGRKPWKEFSYCWLEWWRKYEKSLCYNKDFYTEISLSIANNIQELRYKEIIADRKIIQRFKKLLDFLTKIPLLRHLC